MKQLSNSSYTSDQLQNLITYIYDAALCSDLWKHALEQISKAINAEQGYTRLINVDTNHVMQTYSHNKDPEWVQAYIDYYVHHDIWLNSILNNKANVDIAACTHFLISDKEYESLEYHHDFVRPQGAHFGIGGLIHVKNNITNYIALNREKKKGGFERSSFELFKKLVPHIKKSVLINEKTRKIRLENDLLKDSLNALNSPIVLINEKGKILFINDMTEHLIKEHAGISIINNRITFHSKQANDTLSKLISDASEKRKLSHAQAGSMQYKDVASQTNISLLVTPVNPDMINNDTKYSDNALIIFNLEQKTQFSQELIRGLYSLTKAEARVAALLCQGLTLEAISQRLSVSLNTIKSQLRSCFNKTNTSKQSDLISLVNTGPAGIIKPT